MKDTNEKLPFFIFSVMAKSYFYAVKKKIREINSHLICLELIRHYEKILLKYYPKTHIDGLKRDLLSFVDDKNDSKVKFNEVTLDQDMTNLLEKIETTTNIEELSVIDVLYMILSDDNEIKDLFTKNNISLDSFTYVNQKERSKENKENKKNDEKDKNDGNKNKEESYIDYNQKAINGDFSRVLCRENELNQVIISLLKKTKANPLLIGEPGVGKTAIVEELAKKIISEDVPKKLIGNKIVGVNISSILQGTNLRGQFEGKMEDLLNRMTSDKTNILFLDEIHTLIGSGTGSNNGVDGSNILKPYLARSDIRCIGATTFDDYYKYMRKDKAFSRRFQRIFISEPTEEQVSVILKDLSIDLKKYHSCEINDDVCDYIVGLCKRFLPDRFFPDKAIDCLDHCCAKASTEENVVDRAIVEEVISEFSDVPVSVIRQGDMERLNNVFRKITADIVGNEDSIKSFCNKIKFSYMTNKNKTGVLCTLGVFGPSGVGKKTVINKFSEGVYGKESVITINGNEFIDSSSINKIIGAPPGYTGHDQETYILREIRKRPNCIILIENIKMMHSAVLDFINNIIKNGKVVDVNNMIVDLSKAIFVFCVDIECSERSGMGFLNKGKEDNSSLLSELKKYKTNLKSNIHFIEFKSLEEEGLRLVVKKELEQFVDELKKSCIIVTYEEECIDKLLLEVNGSPASVRMEIREKLESAICLNFNSDVSSYNIKDVDGTIVIEEVDGDFCQVQC